MKHGEIRWYKLLTPDKKRPVLILTRDSALEYLKEVTLAPVTSTVRDIPSEVFLSTVDVVPKDCAVNCNHLQTVSKGKIGSLITSLSKTKMLEVGRAIRFALDIEKSNWQPSNSVDTHGYARLDYGHDRPLIRRNHPEEPC
jgi:mRNA interferase MazF